MSGESRKKEEKKLYNNDQIENTNNRRKFKELIIKYTNQAAIYQCTL